jgi:hypothetical protein
LEGVQYKGSMLGLANLLERTEFIQKIKKEMPPFERQA